MRSGQTSPVPARLRHALTLVSAALLFGGCAGSSQQPDEAEPAGRLEVATLTKLSVQPPAGVEPALWQQLTDRLKQELQLRQAAGKAVSDGPPLSPQSAVSDFYLYASGPNSAALGWGYRSQGDYDQNGIVTIADLTPIGIHFGKDSTHPDWLNAQLADGDRNGEINISDVTPIGQNFGNRVDGWHIEESADLVFPNWQHFATVSGLSGSPQPGGGFLRIGTSLGGLTGGHYYRVVPYAGDAQAGTDVPGIPGNPAGFELSSAGAWPVAECDPLNSGRSKTSGPLVANLLWSHSVDGEVLGPPVSSSRAVFASTTRDFAGGDLYGFDLISGKPLFHYRTADSFIGSPAVSFDGRVFCMDYLGRLHCFAPDGVLLFTRQVAGLCRSGLNLGEQGRVYLAAEDAGQGLLQCLDAEGQHLWSSQLGSNLVFGLPLVDNAAGSLVLLADGRLEHYSFGGGLASQGDLLHPSAGSPVANNSGGLYAVANIPQGPGQAVGTLYSLGGNLQLDWIYGGQGICTGSPALMPDGSAVFATGNFAVDPPTGQVLWVKADGSLNAARSPGAAYGKPAVDLIGNAYVSVTGPSGTNGMYCYDSAYNQLWFHPTGELPPTSPAIVAPNILCFGTQQIFAEAAQSEVVCIGTPIL